jgi:predicted CDP-diglyceride synthetase/phosphatidate cytidylyltransferase
MQNLFSRSHLRGPADIAPALSATAAGVANGVISAVVANVLQKFLDVLDTAHRLGRGLAPGE